MPVESTGSLWVPTLLSNLVTESGVPKLPLTSFRFDHFLECNFGQNSGKYFTVYQWFITEGANEEPCEEVYRVWSRRVLSPGASVPKWRWVVSTFPEQRCVPTWKLFLIQVFMEASPHMCDWVNHWPSVINSISSTSPSSRSWRSESSNLNHRVGSHGNQPHKRCYLGTH